MAPDPSPKPVFLPPELWLIVGEELELVGHDIPEYCTSPYQRVDSELRNFAFLNQNRSSVSKYFGYLAIPPTCFDVHGGYRRHQRYTTSTPLGHKTACSHRPKGS